MLETVTRLPPEIPLILVTAITTHLVISFAQTLMHYKLGHHPMGGKLFRNHINFHHTYYSKIVSFLRPTRTSDCTYQPYEGPRRVCAAPPQQRSAQREHPLDILPSRATRLERQIEPAAIEPATTGYA